MANNQRRQPQDNGIRKVPASSKDIFRLARIESERASQKPVVRRQPILEPRVQPNSSLNAKPRNSSASSQSAASKRTYGSNALPPQRTNQVVKRVDSKEQTSYSSHDAGKDNSKLERSQDDISQSLKDTVKKATADSQNRKNKETNTSNNEEKERHSYHFSVDKSSPENDSYDVNHYDSKKKNRNGFLGFFSRRKEKEEPVKNKDVSTLHQQHHVDEDLQEGKEHIKPSNASEVNVSKDREDEYESSEPIDFSHEVEYQYIETQPGEQEDISPVDNNNKRENQRKPVSISPSSDHEQEDKGDNGEEYVENETTIIETSEPLSPEQINALSSSAVKIVPKNIEKKKRTIGAFSLIMTNWFVGIFTAAVALAGFGYYIYLDAAHEKDTTAAYDQGVRDATSEDTINSVMKKDPQQVKEMIIEAAHGSFPKDVSTTEIIMDGWTVPRGKQNYGRVDVSVCFTGEGVEGNKVAKAHFISDNANSTDPQWMVDAVAITQEDCWK